MSKEQKIFANGFFFKRNEKAPDFVIGRLDIKIEDAIAFLQTNNRNGWVNIDVKKGQEGKYYCELNTFEPKSNQEQVSKPQPRQNKSVVNQEDTSDLPF